LRTIFLISALFFTLIGLTACGQSSDNPAQAVEAYLGALVEKDASSLSSLSCAEWEPTALLELDSLQAVETRLEGLTCSTSAEETDGTFSVDCVGKLLATYNNEDQEIDLSTNTYVVVEQGGEFLVCGYR
jgi:hypothetical protein